MSKTLSTTFVLGAGFSVEARYPLVRTMRDQVLHFLEAERHSTYNVFLEPGNGGFNEGQFYAGLRRIDPDGTVQFEELLLNLKSRLREAETHDPCHVTTRVLRIGAARLLWSIHNSVENVGPSYWNFSKWLGVKGRPHGVISFNWDVQAELLLTQAGVSWSYSLKAGTPIIKPHGSITWSGHLRENLVSDYPYWHPIGKDSRLCYDIREPLANPFKQGINTNFNYMIFPGDSDLPDGDPDIGLLWSDAANLISRSEQVVFIGYSLPTYDSFAVSFFEKSTKGKKVVVINPSLEHLLRFSSVLGDGVELRQQKFKDCMYGSEDPN